MGTVIESKVWIDRAGRRASPWGAAPWKTEAQKMLEGWELRSNGWTVKHPDGTVGIGRVPFVTKDQAQAWVDANPNFPGMYQG